MYIGVLFGWFAYKIEGPGLDGVYSIYQGHLFSKRPPMGMYSLSLTFEKQTF